MAEIDYQLRARVNELLDHTRLLQGQVGLVSNAVDRVGTTQQQTQSELAQLAAEFRAHVLRSRLEAGLQRAHTQIVQVEAQLENKYGYCKIVRNTAIGILGAFDVGLVSEDTVRQVTEELMLTSKRYWLAPALVAVAAWASDDKGLCERAVAEAFRRSPSQTALFFTLVLRRQGRRESSLRWLRHYLRAQDPHTLGREFAVILESASQGAFGADGRALLQETLQQWSEVLRQDPAGQDAQVQLWIGELRAMAPPVADDRFPHLSKASPQWPQLRGALSAAQVHNAVLARYQPLLSEELQPSRRLEDAVDDLLDSLVSEYDPEELPLRRELAFHQQVVAENGDEDRARAGMAAREAALSDSMDYLTLQSTAALAPWDIDVSQATQRLCVAACHGWFGTAHETLGQEYRQALPPQVEVAFTHQVTVGRQSFSLPRWTGSFSRSQEELEQSLRAHWARHSGAFLDGMRFPIQSKVIIPSVVTLVVLLIGLQFSIAGGFLVALLLGGVWALALKHEYNQAESRRGTAEAVIRQQTQESVQRLRTIRAELTDWETAYRQADGQEAEARAFIASLATAVHAPAPYEGRVTERSNQPS